MDFTFPLIISQKLVNGGLKQTWKSPLVQFKIGGDICFLSSWTGLKQANMVHTAGDEKTNQTGRKQKTRL